MTGTRRDGRLQAVAIRESLIQLDRAWDNFFQFHDAADAGAAQQRAT